MHILDVRYKDYPCQGHTCGLCGRKLSSKKQEHHIMVHTETIVSTTIKKVTLIPRKDWGEDYMEIGDYALIGNTCQKKIPKEYKETH